MHKSNLSNDYTDIIIIIIIIISIIINLYWFKWRCHANDAGALYRVISNMNINESREDDERYVRRHHNLVTKVAE